MALIIPDDRSFEARLLDALGLGDKRLSSLSINIAVGERPTVNFSMFIEDNLTDEVIELFKEYVIVEAPRAIHPDEAEDDLSDAWGLGAVPPHSTVTPSTLPITTSTGTSSTLTFPSTPGSGGSWSSGTYTRSAVGPKTGGIIEALKGQVSWNSVTKKLEYTDDAGQTHEVEIKHTEGDDGP